MAAEGYAAVGGVQVRFETHDDAHETRQVASDNTSGHTAAHGARTSFAPARRQWVGRQVSRCLHILSNAQRTSKHAPVLQVDRLAQRGARAHDNPTGVRSWLRSRLVHEVAHVRGTQTAKTAWSPPPVTHRRPWGELEFEHSCGDNHREN